MAPNSGVNGILVEEDLSIGKQDKPTRHLIVTKRNDECRLFTERRVTHDGVNPCLVRLGARLKIGQILTKADQGQETQ